MADFQRLMALELAETSAPQSPLVTAQRVLELAARLLRENGCEHREAVIEAARAAYNQFIRPIDLPGIPNLILEPRVDDAGLAALLWLLNLIADRVCNEQPAPAPTPDVSV